jgi:hypothetical protein
MKTKNILLAILILFCVSARWSQAATLNQAITNLNADAQKPGGPDRVLKSISASTHVPVATLAKEKASTGWSYGDLYAGHAIANAGGMTFDQIAKLKTKGKTWDKVADEANVSLDGKKKVKVTTKTTPSNPSGPKGDLPKPPDMTSGYKARP